MPSGPSTLHKTRTGWWGLARLQLSLSDGMFAIIPTNGWTVTVKWWTARGTQFKRQNHLNRNGSMINSISRTKHGHDQQHADNILQTYYKVWSNRVTEQQQKENKLLSLTTLGRAKNVMPTILGTVQNIVLPEFAQRWCQ